MAATDPTNFTREQIEALGGVISGNVGKARILTTDDYNWNSSTNTATEPYNCVAMWLLPAGFYTMDSSVQVKNGKDQAVEAGTQKFYLIGGYPGTDRPMMISSNGGYYRGVLASSGNLSMKSHVITDRDLENNLTTTGTGYALDARQGKALKDLVDSLAIRAAGAPTTSTVGSVGTLYEDTTNGKLYICTDATNPYVWEEVGAGGGGGITELTSADYNYHASGSVDDGIAFWLLPPGWYEINDENVAVYTNNQSLSTVHVGSYLRFDNQFGNYPKGLLYTMRNSEGIFWNPMSTSGSPYWIPLFGGVRLDTIVSQSTGTSTDSVMSQNATTSMVYADPSTKSKVQIGSGASSTGTYAISLGYNAKSLGMSSIAVGYDAQTTSQKNGTIAIGTNARGSADWTVALGAGAHATSTSAVALGAGSEASTAGVVQIGTNASGWSGYGYNSSDYRLLTGVYDGQSAHDAATYGQVISYSAINGAGAPTTATEGKYVGQLYYDTTNEAMYFLKTIDTTTTPATYTWEALGGGSSVNVVQTTGTSTTDVMSQNAVTSMVYADPATKQKIKIGDGTSETEGTEGIEIGHYAGATGTQSVAIGRQVTAYGTGSVGLGSSANAYGNYGVAIGTSATAQLGTESTIAIGNSAQANNRGSVALGAYSSTNAIGQVNIGTTQTVLGYNSSNYRLLTGLYDPQSDHDAATKGYVDTAVAGAAYDPTISNNTLYL